MILLRMVFSVCMQCRINDVNNNGFHRQLGRGHHSIITSFCIQINNNGANTSRVNCAQK
jgi:hypothetical protein